MKCIKCGGNVSNGICDICGANQSVGLNKRNIVILASVAIVAIAAALIFRSRSTTEKEGIYYFYSVLNESALHYQAELDLFINNLLLEQVKESLTLPYSHTIKLVNGEIELNNDTNSKILSGVVTLDSLPASIDFYITDDKFILGSETMLFLEADIKNLSADISAFTLKNGLHHYGELIEKILFPLDLSYTNLTKLNVVHPISVTKAFWIDYKDTFKKLFDESIYIQSVDSKGVKTVEIVPDTDIFYNWVKNDFAPKAKSDTLLKIKLSSLYIDYDKFIAALDNFIQAESSFSAKFKFGIYNDIITTACIEYGYEGNIKTTEIMAVGTENNIDNLKYLYKDKNSEIEISAVGKHTSADIFSSGITVSANSIQQGEIIISWDSDEIGEIFQIIAEPNKIIMTYPQREKNIVLTVPDNKYIPITLWEISKLEKTVQLPDNTIQIKDASLISLIGQLGELLKYFY